MPERRRLAAYASLTRALIDSLIVADTGAHLLLLAMRLM